MWMIAVVVGDELAEARRAGRGRGGPLASASSSQRAPRRPRVVAVARARDRVVGAEPQVGDVVAERRAAGQLLDDAREVVAEEADHAGLGRRG